MDHLEREKNQIQFSDDGTEPYSSSSELCLCRICHEEEEMELNTMEAPCGCSGTLKFAHRGCIQRWCEEKGSTFCEICLQKFNPGYTLPAKNSQLIDVMVTIRGSLEVPRLNYEPYTANFDRVASNYNDPECSPPSEGGTSLCRPVPLMVATMLLIWQLVVVIKGDEEYPFALTTVLLLRTGGILLPFCLVMRVISAIQRSQMQQQIQRALLQRHETVAPVEEEQEISQHIIEIQS